MKAQAYSVKDETYTRIQEGDLVYIINRHGQYKHTAHVVRRLHEGGPAVTCCTIWIRGTDSAVRVENEDSFVWCENGCLQAQRTKTAQEGN